MRELKLNRINNPNWFPLLLPTEKLNERAHEIVVLIALSFIEGAGETLQMHKTAHTKCMIVD